jgi:hypothetical protein
MATRVNQNPIPVLLAPDEEAIKMMSITNPMSANTMPKVPKIIPVTRDNFEVLHQYAGSVARIVAINAATLTTEVPLVTALPSLSWVTTSVLSLKLQKIRTSYE